MVEALKKNNPVSDKLSDRELQILGLYATGLERNEISACTTLSEYTVRAHIRNVRSKLDANSIPDALIKGLDSQQLNIDDFVNDYDLLQLGLLTPRQKEAFFSLYKNRNVGLKNEAISQDMDLGHGTVKIHQYGAFKRLGINSQNRAIVLGYAAEQRGMSF
jgi:DNA-binding NarL/FixJ family response regulator